MSDILKGFLPKDISKYIEREEADLYILFADLKGFTAMSEDLAKYKLEGAELLANIINKAMSYIIQVVENYNGIIYKFAGDAVTIYFQAEDTKPENVIKCACEIIDTMKKNRTVTAYKVSYEIGIKLGLSYGKMRKSILENEDYNDYLLIGDIAERAFEAESRAEEYDIIIDSNLKEKIGDIFAFENLGDGYYKFIDNKNIINTAVNIQKNKKETIVDNKIYSKFMHPALANIMLENPNFIGEFRKTVIIFISFEIEDLLNNSQKMLKLYASFYSDVKNYGGYINKIDIGDKGARFLIFFGTPISYENSEYRALFFLKEIITKYSEFKFKAGIESGFIFTGIVGSKERHEYTGLGTAVNYTARIMVLAQKGNIILGKNIFNDLSIYLSEYSILEANLKGISDTQKLYVISPEYINNVKPEKIKEKCLGRQKEYDELLKLWADEKNIVYEISGKPGIGKSVFLENIDEYINAKFEIIEINPLDAGKPFSFINIFVDKCLENFKENIPEKFKDAYYFIKNENHNIQDLNNEEKRKAFFNLLGSFLVYCYKQTNKFFIIDDLQWIDYSSYEALRYFNLSNNKKIIFSYRDYFKTIWDNKVVIELNEFDIVKTELLIKNKYKLKGISQKIIDEIYKKTEGNPFFTLETVKYLLNNDLVVIIDEELLIKDESEAWQIPSTIYEVILSRMDKLNEQEKKLLKLASVIGKNFRFDVLNNLTKINNVEQLKKYLNELSQFELTLMDKPIPVLEYIFKHMITRDVAYDTLLYSEKRKVHQKVAKYLEKILKNEKNINIFNIFYHYKCAENIKSALKYALKGINEAIENNNYDAMIPYLEFIFDKSDSDFLKAKYITYYIDILIMKGELEKCKEIINQFKTKVSKKTYKKLIVYECEILITQGKNTEAYNILSKIKTREYELFKKILLNKIRALVRIGEFNKALQIIRQNMKNPSKELIARLIYWKGIIYEQRGLFKQSLEIFKSINDIFNFFNYDKIFYISILEKMAILYDRLGDENKFLFTVSEIFSFLDEINNVSKKAQIYFIMGNFYNIRGNYTKAEEYYNLANEIYLKLGDKNSLAVVLNNLGNIYLEKSEYDKALQNYFKALDYVKEINNKKQISLISGNIGDVYTYLKDFDKALEYYEVDLNFSKELGDIEGEAHVYGNLANIQDELGNYDKAIYYYNKQIELCSKIDDYIGIGKAYYNMGEMYQSKFKNYDKAMENYNEAKKYFTKMNFKRGLEFIENNIKEMYSENSNI